MSHIIHGMDALLHDCALQVTDVPASSAHWCALTYSPALCQPLLRCLKHGLVVLPQLVTAQAGKVGGEPPAATTATPAVPAKHVHRQVRGRMH